jgi:hypothetical protein
MYVEVNLPAIQAVQVGSNNILNPVANQYAVVTDEDLDENPDNASEFVTSTEPFAHWVNIAGIAAIEHASLIIGGNVIDQFDSHFMYMWFELSGNIRCLENLMGKKETREELIEASKSNQRFYVPLPFWFCRHSGNSLPLISLQFHTAKVALKLRALREMIQVSGHDISVVKADGNGQIQNNDVQVYLHCKNVYLDQKERQLFSSGSFYQLVQLCQSCSFTTEQETHTYSLCFNHPVIELIFSVTVRDSNNEVVELFDYSCDGKDPIEVVSLSINNNMRFRANQDYLKNVQSLEAHSNIPENCIYTYSFALNPEDDSPSGSLNMSRMDNAQMSFKFCPEAVSEGRSCLVRIYARNWNVMKYTEGLCGLVYAN